MKDFNMEVGERVRALRKAAGQTQEELARNIGVETRAVSRKETGENAWSIYEITQVSAIYGVSLEYLLCGMEKENKGQVTAEPLSSDERRLLDCYRLLSAEGQRDILGLAIDYLIRKEHSSE